MSLVKIVTDSNAFLPDPGAIDRLGIEVIPLTIQIGQQRYREGVDISHEECLTRMAEDPDLVSVATPSIDDLAAVFARLGKTTDHVVCLHVSSALQDIVDVAERAASRFLGRLRITVLDTASVSVGLGLVVQAAGEAAAAGASQSEVVRITRGMIPHLYALFFSDSLRYLEIWGRLGSAQTLLGTMLGLKPLATMEDGELLPIEKVREYPHAVEKLHDFIVEFSHIEQMYLVERGLSSTAAQLLDRLSPLYPGRRFPVIGYPPSLGVHVGPKALGVIVYEGDR